MSSKLEQLVQQKVLDIVKENEASIVRERDNLFKGLRGAFGFLIDEAGGKLWHAHNSHAAELTFQIGDIDYTITLHSKDAPYGGPTHFYFSAMRDEQMLWELGIKRMDDVLRTLALKAEVKS